MAFTRIFDGKVSLDELDRSVETMQRVKIANLVSIQGRKAELDDETKMNLNVAQFDPQDDRSDVHDDLKLAKKADATVQFLAQMAQEGRAQVGGDMDVFIADQPVTIVVFGKTTS